MRHVLKQVIWHMPGMHILEHKEVKMTDSLQEEEETDGETNSESEESLLLEVSHSVNMSFGESLDGESETEDGNINFLPEIEAVFDDETINSTDDMIGQILIETSSHIEAYSPSDTTSLKQLKKEISMIPMRQ